LHSPQKFKRPSFWNGYSYSIKHYGAEVTFNGQLVQKLIGGGREALRHTDKMVISLAYILIEKGKQDKKQLK
jgi:hypothetical protein